MITTTISALGVVISDDKVIWKQGRNTVPSVTRLKGVVIATKGERNIEN